MKLLMCCAALVLSGCTSLPSVQLCHDVQFKYVRKGNVIDLTDMRAKCELLSGPSGIIPGL